MRRTMAPVKPFLSAAAATDRVQEARISVVIPAFNEAAYLGPTIDAVRRSFETLPAECHVRPEIIVVDNASTDGTADVARALGTQVVTEPLRGVARARNAGARAASGEILVFLDADTLVPLDFAPRLTEAACDPGCLGGAFDTDHRPARASLRVYLAFWRVVGLCLRVGQGAAQFCRRSAFDALGGYDERLHMGEDVRFYQRLKRLARQRGARVRYIWVAVVPSPRRWDRWPLWKTLVWTNPVAAGLLGRWQGLWRGWHETPPR